MRGGVEVTADIRPAPAGRGGALLERDRELRELDGLVGAALEGRPELETIKHGYEDNRKILIEGLPKAGLDAFLPADGAFYLYADVSKFTDNSLDFARDMLERGNG